MTPTGGPIHLNDLSSHHSAKNNPARGWKRAGRDETPDLILSITELPRFLTRRPFRAEGHGLPGAGRCKRCSVSVPGGRTSREDF